MELYCSLTLGLGTTCTGQVGDYEAWTPVCVESPLGYHPCSTGILTIGLESGLGTPSGGQFDWGGRLLKSNGGAQGFLSTVGNRAKSVNAKGSLIARHTGRARTKVGLSDPVGTAWKGHRSTDKSYLGITGLSPPRVHIDGEVWHLDVGSSHPGAVVGPKGWAVRPLKWYASWVQNVVRQFGPYPSQAQEI